MPEIWTGRVVSDMHLAQVSQEELAERVGVKRPYLNAVLNGKRKASAALQEQIQNAAHELLLERMEQCRK